MTPWQPQTFEDHLLQQYLVENPGELFLEVEVGGRDELRGPRRIDGVLIPGSSPRVRRRDTYRARDVREALRGQTVHVLEAKRRLNRNVLGQVEVGEALLNRDLKPGRTIGVAVVAAGNADLQWYCEQKNIGVAIYPQGSSRRRSDTSASQRVDRRTIPPGPAHEQAFMRGWDAAVQGRLFGSVRTRTTHTGMGNLFGWIYGDQPESFRQATWGRYVQALPRPAAVTDNDK